jgi:TPR repeat protein
LDTLRIRRFRDPEGCCVEFARTEALKRLSEGELDLEDEVLHSGTEEWIPLWRDEGFNPPEGWALLLDQHSATLRDLKSRVRHGEVTYSYYVELRARLLREVKAGAARTEIQGRSPLGSSEESRARLARHLGNRYTYERDLGEGGAGSVSLWAKSDTGAKVAIKVTKPQFKDHIGNELKQLELIRSPSVVHVRDYGQFDDGRWYIIFDYVPGETLLEFIRREHAIGRLQAEEIMHVLQGIARGLADLHRAGIVHRDLKPANIILKPTGGGRPTPVLIDLGMARSGTPSGHTILGGTAGYQSPEQQQGHPCTPASDIYCFGLIAYELVTGRRLAGGRLKVLHAECPGLPTELDRLVKERCAVDEPNERVSDGTALVTAMENTLRGATRPERQRDGQGEIRSDPPATQSETTPAKSKQEEPESVYARALEVWDQCVSNSADSGSRSALSSKALALFKEAAKQGHTEAIWWLGKLYLDGSTEASVNADLARATYWLTQAAEAGDADAMVELGHLYRTGRPARPLAAPFPAAPTRAFEFYRRAAESGHAEGMLWLGVLLFQGEGVAPDNTQAFIWFQRSVEAGNATGMYWLGECFYRGVGTKQSFFEAAAWFRKSADSGDSNGMFSRSKCLLEVPSLTTDKTEAVQWLLKAAELGNDGAMELLGQCYQHGLGGLARDLPQAKSWFRRAVDAGHQGAQQALDELAKVNSTLGDQARTGAGDISFGVTEGVRREETPPTITTLEELRLRASSGDSKAWNRLGLIYAKGKDVAKDDAQAVEYFLKAAQLGSTDAMINLGRCFEFGRGVAPDLDASQAWYNKALSRGRADAHEPLQRVLARVSAWPAGERRDDNSTDTCQPTTSVFRPPKAAGGPVQGGRPPEPSREHRRVGSDNEPNPTSGCFARLFNVVWLGVVLGVAVCFIVVLGFRLWNSWMEPTPYFQQPGWRRENR